jgi:glucokinase
MTDGVIIGVDLGGTRIRAARCDTQLNIIKREEILTKAEGGLDATLGRIKGLIQQVLPDNDTPVIGIGISAPGPLNPDTGVVVAPPNLPGWHNVPLGDILHEAFNVPIFVGNDANVAALAETVRGAAIGCRNVIYITVSTGIGGGIITDGHMLLGDVGLGAEVGHMTIVAGETVTTLEKEAAGPALARKLRAALEAGETSDVVRGLVGDDLSTIDGKVVGQAVHAGDPLAVGIVKRSAELLGLGMVSLLHLFNPEIIVIGGGVASGLGRALTDPVRQMIETYSLDSAYWENLSIVPPKLHEDVSIIGSVALVKTRGGVRRVDDVMGEIDA